MSTELEPKHATERLGVLRNLCKAQGRRFEDLSLYHKLFINIGEARKRADGSREAGTGMPAEIVDDLRRMADLGYSSFIVRYRGNDADRQRQQLRIFISDIIPKV